MRISRIFGLELQQPQLDFVDVDVDHDTPLFLDPFAFAQREDSWSIDCHNLIVSFFQSAVDYIRVGEHDRAREILHNLSEPNETCLGLSRGTPQGRGVSGKQALDVYDKLAESEAVRTGFLSELADCELLIEGIGPDKISDITTNIIRGKLIEYTQQQCRLHGLALGGEVASGRLWDPNERHWNQQYVQLPIVNGRKIVLVPKASVRWSIAIDHQEYYQHFVLNFLQQDHIDQSTALVHTLRSGERREENLGQRGIVAYIRKYCSLTQVLNSKPEEQRLRNLKHEWNNARDKHNQTVKSWEDLAKNINHDAGQRICFDHCGFLKTIG